jgi:hypothetical protein
LETTEPYLIIHGFGNRLSIIANQVAVLFSYNGVMLTEGGLDMVDLPEFMQKLCRSLHREFLGKHHLESWPVRISFVPVELIPNTPRQCVLEVVYGTGSSRKLICTSELELELQKAFRFLEVHHQQMTVPQKDPD